MMIRFFHDGKHIDYTPGSAVTAGSLVVQKGLIGINKLDIAANALGSIAVEGVFAVPKKNEVIAAGLPLWWDANGDPQGGIAGTGAATQIASGAMAADDALLGMPVKSASAADTVVYVKLNAVNPLYPAWPNKNHVTKSDNYTVTVEDGGTILHIATDAKTFTLPSTVAGLRVTIVNDGTDGGVGINISPAALDKILGSLVAGTATDNKDVINTKATAKRGDYIILQADGADGWYIVEKRGVWEREA